MRLARITTLAIVCIIAAGCGSTQNTHLDTSPGAYSPATQGTLTGGCSVNADNLPSGYCECALKTLEARIPESQLGDLTTAGQAMVDDKDIRRICA